MTDHFKSYCDPESRQFNQSLTIKFLDGQFVIQVQLEVGYVLHRTLVVRPHDGRIRGGMGQAQCMAKLMHCNCEQVCAAADTCVK